MELITKKTFVLEEDEIKKAIVQYVKKEYSENIKEEDLFFTTEKSKDVTIVNLRAKTESTKVDPLINKE